MATQTIYKAPRNQFRLEGNRALCDTDKPYKISGTYLGAVLGDHPYKSQFSAAVDMFGLADADLTANKAVNAGHVCEVPLIEEANRVFRDSVGMFIPAEKFTKERAGEHGDWEPDFEHPIFTGHVDGTVIGVDGQQYLLEVKTTKDYRDTGYSGEWFRPKYEFNQPVLDENGEPVYIHGGLPDHYYWQVALYNEFYPDMQKDFVYVLVGFMTEESYEHPEKWVPDFYGNPEKGIKPNAKLMRVPLDREEIRRGLETAEAWYNEYIRNGITPEYDPSINRDYELWNHLLTVSSPKGVIQSMIDRDNYLKEYLAPLIREQEQLDKNIKEWMGLNSVSDLTSEYGLVATTKVQTRSSLDQKRLEKELGLNLDDYKKTTTYKVFSIDNPNAPKKGRRKEE